MKLNKIEQALMNNPLRVLIQRYYEAPLLERLGGRVDGLRVLEIGCGRGVGLQILFELFGAREVHGFDLDLQMVREAKKRLRAYSPDRLKLSVGSADSIAAENESFDAVFDFGALHHVQNWQHALSEIRRVLRSNGRFFYEEVTSQALNRWFYRTFLKHPKENRFSIDEFVSELQKLDFDASDKITLGPFSGDFIIGVAWRR